MSNQEIIHAYRHLYRAALRAVCYSQPASTVARNQLRGAFRHKHATFDERAIRRTVWFLKNAAKDTGIEHKIVKNLLFVKFWKDNVGKLDRPAWKAIVEPSPSGRTSEITGTHYVHYEKTIEMLNKTMGICLPLP